MSRRWHRVLLIALALAALVPAAVFAPRIARRARLAWRMRTAPWHSELGGELFTWNLRNDMLRGRSLEKSFTLQDGVLGISNRRDSAIFIGKRRREWSEYVLELEARSRGNWAFLGRLALVEDGPVFDRIAVRTPDDVWTKVLVRAIDGRYELFVDGEPAGESPQMNGGAPGGFGFLVEPNGSLEIRSLRAQVLSVSPDEASDW